MDGSSFFRVRDPFHTPTRRSEIQPDYDVEALDPKKMQKCEDFVPMDVESLDKLSSTQATSTSPELEALDQLIVDVGGTQFQTSLSSVHGLVGYAKNGLSFDVYKQKMCMFIDRDPTHFETVLNYLRTGRVALPQDVMSLREIIAEAQYYELETLEDEATEKLRRMLTHTSVECPLDEMMTDDGPSLDLAYEKRAFASSSEIDPGHTCPSWTNLLHPAFATDGCETTRWASALDRTWIFGNRVRVRGGKDGEWLAVDLGEECIISKISINWERAFAAKYVIQVSHEAPAPGYIHDEATARQMTWRDVMEVEIGGPGEAEHILLSPTPARCVRILCTKRGTRWGISVFRLAVYGRPLGTEITHPSCATASSSTLTHRHSDGPHVALERSFTSAWSSARTPVSHAPLEPNVYRIHRGKRVGTREEWVRIDLDSPCRIAAIRTVWTMCSTNPPVPPCMCSSKEFVPRFALPESIQVEVSADGEAWRQPGRAAQVSEGQLNHHVCDVSEHGSSCGRDSCGVIASLSTCAACGMASPLPHTHPHLFAAAQNAANLAAAAQAAELGLANGTVSALSLLMARGAARRSQLAPAVAAVVESIESIDAQLVERVHLLQNSDGQNGKMLGRFVRICMPPAPPGCAYRLNRVQVFGEQVVSMAHMDLTVL